MGSPILGLAQDEQLHFHYMSGNYSQFFLYPFSTIPSCQPINTFKLSNHCPAHSVKRDFINLLIVHWNRQLQLQVSIKIHLLFLHTLWQEIRSPCTHCDKTYVKKWHLLQPEIGWLTRRKWKIVLHLEMTCCVWPGLRIRFWKSI